MPTTREQDRRGARPDRRQGDADRPLLSGAAANILAAVNRFKTVVEEYQTTRHVEEALHRLTESYLALGIVPEAQTAAAVLGHNFPDSEWYQDSYALLGKGGIVPTENEGSWISRAFAAPTALDHWRGSFPLFPRGERVRATL